MKLVDGKISLTLRLAAVATALLFGQQAMAIGTAAGTQVDNTVSVDYDVSGVDQTDLTATVSFVVDRRVDFDLTAMGGALVPVTPGQNDAFFDFMLTNDSNSPLDFNLLLTELVGGAVRTGTDDANMGAVDYAVSANSLANGDPDPVRLGPQFVDELAADDSIRIRVFGDAALTMLNGEVAGVQLDATAAEPNTVGEGAALVEAANTDLGIENVFAEDGAGGDGVQFDIDGWVVASADLAVTKAYNVIAGDLGSGLPIPGAIVEYTITIVNSSATDADAVIIDDAIDTDVVLNLNVAAYSGNDIDVDNDGTTLPCDVEINGDGDGCDLVGQDITVGAADLVPSITVAGNTTLTLTYQVTIPDPDPTP